MLLRRSLLAVPLCLATACATTQPATKEAPPPQAGAAQPPQQQAPQQFDLQAQVARELPAPLPKRPVMAPDGHFRTQVEAAGEVKVEPREGVTSVIIPLGTDSPVQCYVYREAVDAGARVNAVVQAVAKELQLKLVRPMDLQVVRGAPAMFFEVVYTAQTEAGTAAGQVKMMMHADNAAPVLCMHDELGYAKSFQRVATDFARSLETAEPPTAPRFNDVQAVRINDIPVGFEWRALYDADEGATMTETITAMFMPRSATDLLVQDTTVRELTDKGGQLQRLQYAKLENGEPQLQVGLTREKKGYAYEGEQDGKPLKGTFAAPKGGLLTETTSAPRVKKDLLEGTQKQLTFHHYSPGVNPAGPIPVVYAKVEGGAPRAVNITFSQMTLQAVLDANGFLEKGTLPLGGATMVQQRLEASGTP